MVAVTGSYQNGNIKLDRRIAFDKPIKVIITFLKDNEIFSEKRLMLTDFSFSESKKLLDNCSKSFTNTLIEERPSEL